MRPTLYLLGLGPGAVDELSLKAWELLASGNPVLIRDPEHEAAQTAAARGVRFEVTHEVDPRRLADEVVDWAVQHDSSVYGVSGHPLESPESLEIIRRARQGDFVAEVVSAPTDLERLPAFDPLTRAHATPEALRAGIAFMRLVQVMARLRGPDGCPWDREQTHASLALHLLEETYETLHAIDDNSGSLPEELGDLLLQVVFHSELAREADRFDSAEVVEGLLQKLFQRHPHVFGNVAAETSAQVLANWETLKRSEKGRTSKFDDIPPTLPALVTAYKVWRRAQNSHEGPRTEMTEEKVGELLFEVVAAAGSAGIDPEGALRKRVASFIQQSDG